MFEYLKNFKKIIVTGPNRSGTRICARMISHDLGYPFIDEQDIHIDSLHSFSHYLFAEERLVIQCPSLSRYIHFFNSDRWAVVFMKRKKSDIITSQERIDWSWEWLERIRYNRITGKISDIKYRYLDSVQRKKIKNLFEIDYDSLDEHPMWIKKRMRSSFDPEQFILAENSIDEIGQLYPIRSPGVSSHFLNNESSAILMNSKRELKQIYSTGIRIWNLCSGNLKSEEIVKQIMNDFNSSNKNNIEEETLNFILALSKKKFIQLLRIRYLQ